MIEASATDFAKRLGQYRRAAQREPVAVRDRSGVTEVLISKHDYDEFQRLRAMQTRAVRAIDLTNEDLAAIADSRMDPRHAHLDALLND